MIVATAAAGATTTTLVEGVRAGLPGLALDSDVLFHAERGLALLVVGLAALTVLMRAWRGELPIELSTSGVRYHAGNEDDLERTVAAPQVQLNSVQSVVESLAIATDDPPIIT